MSLINILPASTWSYVFAIKCDKKRNKQERIYELNLYWAVKIVRFIVIRNKNNTLSVTGKTHYRKNEHKHTIFVTILPLKVSRYLGNRCCYNGYFLKYLN